MKDNPRCHFFLDEFPVGVNGLNPVDLKKLADKISDEFFLWIACQTQKSPPAKEIERYGSYFSFSSRTIKLDWD
jgi:hypothetical protein